MIEYIYEYSREITGIVIVVLIFLYLFKLSRKLSSVEKQIREISKKLETLKDETGFIREYVFEINRDTSYLKGLLTGKEEEKS